MVFIQVSWAHENSTSYTDGTATFTIHYNDYFQLSTILLVIHSMEVFRMEFSYDLNRYLIIYTKELFDYLQKI